MTRIDMGEFNNRYIIDEGPMDLKQLAAHGFKIAKGIIEEGNSLEAIFLILGPEMCGMHPIARVPVRWSCPDEKLHVFDMVRRALRDTKSYGYVFICEAWVSKVGKDGVRPSRMPSEDPNRTEVLMVSGHDQDGHSIWLSGEITREDGVVSVSEPEPHMSRDEGFGNAANFLKLPEELVGTKH